VKLTFLTAITGLLVLVVIFELVRRRQLREKYSLLWGLVGVVVVPLAFFPRLLDTIANTLGVVSGVSLVLFLGFVFLLLVCLHLSWEVSRLEEETRTLAEDIALLRTEVRARATADQAAARRAGTDHADDVDQADVDQSREPVRHD
jgi:hypothetical protein